MATVSTAGVVVSCKIPILATRVRFPGSALFLPREDFSFFSFFFFLLSHSWLPLLIFTTNLWWKMGRSHLHSKQGNGGGIIHPKICSLLPLDISLSLFSFLSAVNMKSGQFKPPRWQWLPCSSLGQGSSASAAHTTEASPLSWACCHWLSLQCR